MNRLAGYLAGLSWVALAAATLAGAVLRNPSLPEINYFMVAVFAAIGAFVMCRTAAFDRLLRACPATIETRHVRRLDLTASLSMLVLGAACVSGASLRVWSEGRAVFG